MRITSVRTELLRLPMPRPMLSGSSGGAKGKPVENINMPVVLLETQDGHLGLGYAWNLMGGGPATVSVLSEEIAPLLIGMDALNHERIWETIYRRLQSVGRAGVVTQAQAAIDLAVWDLKGKKSGLPVWKILGGMRDRVPVYGSDGGWLYMSVDAMLNEFEDYQSKGMPGVKMKVGHDDPAIDIDRVTEVRRRLSSDVWLAVDANQQWTYEKALIAGRAFEKLGIAWLEEPLLCEDVEGHKRLVEKLDIPIALGETLASRHEFSAYLRAGAVDIIQPDVIRAGGITECLKIIQHAEILGRAVAPHHMMEASIHLVCGVMRHGPIEYMPWISRAFEEEMPIEDGRIVPSMKPGLGLTISEDTIHKFRVDTDCNNR